MNRSKSLLIALSLGLVAPSAFAADGIAVEFKNSSSWEIHHIYLSPVNEKDWGEDQLGDAKDDIIEPGSSFTLTDITPSKYDIKLVDEDGDDCTVGGVSIKASETVDLTDKMLVGCQVATAAEADEGEEG